MSQLFIDGVSAPIEIKDQLKVLSRDIKITRELKFHHFDLFHSRHHTQ